MEITLKNDEAIDSIRMKVKELWEACLGKKIYSTSEDFFDLGGDSLIAISLIGQINTRFKLNLFVGEIFDYPTIDTLSLQIKNKKEGQKTSFKDHSNFVILNEFKADKKTLFIIHDGTGKIDGYVYFVNRISDHINCIGINFPNAQLYPVNISLEELGKGYVKILDSVLEDSTEINLAGWSTGGKIALEMASQLEQLKYKVNAFLFDMPKIEKSKNYFEVDTELKILEQFLLTENMTSLRKKVRKAQEVNEIWDYVAQSLEHDFNFDKANSIFSRIYPTQNLDQSSSINLLKSFNLLRTLDAAQSNYELKRRLQSQIYHYIPEKSLASSSNKIALFEEKVFVKGDHFSMMNTHIEPIINHFVSVV